MWQGAKHDLFLDKGEPWERNCYNACPKLWLPIFEFSSWQKIEFSQEALNLNSEQSFLPLIFSAFLTSQQ